MSWLDGVLRLKDLFPRQGHHRNGHVQLTFGFPAGLEERPVPQVANDLVRETRRILLNLGSGNRLGEWGATWELLSILFSTNRE